MTKPRLLKIRRHGSSYVVSLPFGQAKTFADADCRAVIETLPDGAGFVVRVLQYDQWSPRKVRLRNAQQSADLVRANAQALAADAEQSAIQDARATW